MASMVELGQAEAKRFFQVSREGTGSQTLVPSSIAFSRPFGRNKIASGTAFNMHS